MNKRCIVNVATGDFYCKKQDRLVQAFFSSVENIRRYNPDGSIDEIVTNFKTGIDLVVWRNTLPEGRDHKASSHSDSPYGFKVHAIQYVMKIYSSVLWVDSPAYPVKEDISPIFDKIEHEGYYAMSHTDPLDNWIGERVLNLMKIPRERLKGLHLPSGSCYGFDLDNLHTKVIFERFYRLEQAGYFQSEHLYMGGEVIGWHRHDEAILALLLLEAGKPVFYYDPLFQSDDERCVIKSGDGAKNF